MTPKTKNLLSGSSGKFRPTTAAVSQKKHRTQPRKVAAAAAIVLGASRGGQLLRDDVKRNSVVHTVPAGKGKGKAAPVGTSAGSAAAAATHPKRKATSLSTSTATSISSGSASSSNAQANAASCESGNTGVKRSRVKGAGASTVTPPAWMVCPLSKQVMTDPVNTRSGPSYERTFLEEYLKEHETEPNSGLNYLGDVFYPNRGLLLVIQYWQKNCADG